MTLAPRQLALGAALAGTLAATAWVALQPDDEPAAVAALPARRTAPVVTSSASASAPATSMAATAAAREPWSEPTPTQLAAWQPPPAPPPPPPPPAPPPVAAAPTPPVAPPAPYQMIGRVIEGEGARAVEVALLSGPNKAVSARPGDVIDGQWRVEQVSESGVRLIWLPGQLPQNIVFRQAP